MISIALLLIALVGHAALWIGAVNRIHGIGLPKAWKEVGTWASFALLAGVPVAVAWRLWSSAAWTFGRGIGPELGPLSGYVKLCVVVACCVVVARLLRFLSGEAHGVVAERSVRVIDFAANADLAALVPCQKSRRFARLPGNELFKLSVEEKTIGVPGLPADLEGLKIAHISDLHISGRIAVEYHVGVIELANSWRPDIVALTGDLIENVSSLEHVGPTYGQLAAEYGVFYVLGNHDAHGDADELRRRLDACGHTGLGGRWADIEINGTTLRLAGNELPWFSPAADLSSTPDGPAATFALVHGPDQFGWARRHGVSLVLAGHNHGGQIRLPFVGPIVAPSLQGTRYASGAFRRGNTVMHVSRGGGSMAPIRYNCPPELALLTLKSDTGPPSPS